MIQCKQGHYYDEIQYSACPHCGLIDLDLGRTQAHIPQGERQADSPMVGKTQRVIERRLGFDPVVGWLVCVEGPDAGRDYRIQSGRNFIGRASPMHINIAGDDAISREKHAVISYDPRHNRFKIAPGEGAELTYLNGEAVEMPVALKPRDVIMLGATKLVFIPFCDDTFQWKADKDSGDNVADG